MSNSYKPIDRLSIKIYLQTITMTDIFVKRYKLFLYIHKYDMKRFYTFLFIFSFYRVRFNSPASKNHGFINLIDNTKKKKRQVASFGSEKIHL